MNSRIWLVAASVLTLSATAQAQSAREMQFHAAARDCYLPDVIRALEAGVNIDARSSGGETALMYAATYGCEEIAQLLVERGAKPDVEMSNGWTAAYLAKINRYPAIEALIEGALKSAAPQAVVAEARGASRSKPMSTSAAEVGQGTSSAPLGGKEWPRLGQYKVGERVLYSGSGGKTWEPATIKSIDPKYGYNFPEVSGSSDAYFVVSTKREPFWTQWFIGDWKVTVPTAMNLMTDGRNVFRVVSGGMRLPPLRILADGSYHWRYEQNGEEKLIKGRWVENPNGPGVILKSAAEGADWLVYNNSRTNSELGETVILSSECCSHLNGSRL